MAHFRAVLGRARSHLTRNVVGYLALFVALGGTSYGLASGSVDTREIRNNTVRTNDLRNNEIRSRDIRNRTIVARDLLSNTLGGDQVDETELGEVPLATRSKSADDALTLGGEAPGAFARPPLAATVDVPDSAGAVTDLLEIPGFGLLRAAENACETEAASESFSLRYVNTTSVGMESFFRTSAATTHSAVPADGQAAATDAGTQSYIVLRLAPADGSDSALTATLFSDNAGSACRVSLQAVVSP
jgi:hypothetical protein